MMKKILVVAFAMMLLVLVGASAQASLWVPTPSGDLDVNYVLPVSTAGTFAIFDDSYHLDGAASTGNYLPLIPSSGMGFETIYFSQVSGGWELRYDSSSTAADFTLTGDNTFQLAWYPLGIPTGATGATSDYWYLDTGYAGDNGVYSVSWTNVGSSQHSSSLIQIDAVPSAVPVPPSVVMLFTGLLGLVGVRRMRKDS